MRFFLCYRAQLGSLPLSFPPPHLAFTEPTGGLASLFWHEPGALRVVKQVFEVADILNRGCNVSQRYTTSLVIKGVGKGGNENSLGKPTPPDHLVSTSRFLFRGEIVWHLYDYSIPTTNTHLPLDPLPRLPPLYPQLQVILRQHSDFRFCASLSIQPCQISTEGVESPTR